MSTTFYVVVGVDGKDLPFTLDSAIIAADICRLLAIPAHIVKVTREVIPPYKVPYDEALAFCKNWRGKHRDSRLGQDFVNRYGFQGVPKLFYEKCPDIATDIILTDFTKE